MCVFLPLSEVGRVRPSVSCVFFHCLALLAPYQVLPPSPPLQLLRQLDLERSARHDLEMHSEQLRAQKSLLHDEVTSLKHKLEQGGRGDASRLAPCSGRGTGLV